MQGEIDPALVERCVALVRRLSASGEYATSLRDLEPHFREIKAIVAELPEPVDPDLIEARRIVADHIYGDVNAHDLVVGKYESGLVDSALAGIKRGRQLEQEGR